MWTINDFPTYRMVSSWSLHGKLTCSYCMENKKAFTLTNGGKASFFSCHRCFLPTNHKYRKNRNDFFVHRVVKDVAPPHLSGEELHDVVSQYDDIVFGCQSGKQKFLGFGLAHNWVKWSIFWELPFWKTNLLRHNLDVIYIEKNVFENIFNTIMDVKGKTNDNIKARLDLALFCNPKNMELIFDGSRVAKPRASFMLEKNAQLLVYKWLKSMCFLDGDVLNISRLVNIEECRLYEMKSYDCHVFMQTLIPLFFDLMEHLPIHLPYETKVGVPVQYRWMYLFERLDIIVAM